MRYIKPFVIFMMVLAFTMSLSAVANAQTLEEYLNNLVGPISQYDTELSPAYVRNNQTEEYISPQNGDLKLTYTDYVLKGVNGLDLEIKRIYKSSQSNIFDMNTKYVNGVWVDYTENMESSFYEERYNLGVGMRFSFSTIEIRDDNMYLHSETGDTYKIKKSETSSVVYYLDGHLIEDIIIKEDYSYTTSKWTDGIESLLTSKYVMIEKDGKRSYFDNGGRLLGIVDRYGNKINFEYSALKHETYTDTDQNRKILITKITDSVGRIINIEYTYDSNYSLIVNGDGTISEDLGDNFQVIIYLPDNTTDILTDNKTIIYNKSMAHYENIGGTSNKLWRTKIDKVYDIDGGLKYHYTWDKENNGFTFTNDNNYSINNIYWNIIQINYTKTNKINRYDYGTYTKKLGDSGSMQYNKVIKKQDLSQTSWDDSQTNYLDKFICDIENEITYTYINEPSGYGYTGYQDGNENYLRNTYRYYSKAIDSYGVTITYTYNGLSDLLNTESIGNNHKIVTTTTYDEYAMPKKKETKTYNYSYGLTMSDPLVKIENFTYDKYGNLTSYTVPDIHSYADGTLIDKNNTIEYTYATDKYHVLTSKTWKSDENTLSKIEYTVDDKGNVINKEVSHQIFNYIALDANPSIGAGWHYMIEDESKAIVSSDIYEPSYNPYLITGLGGIHKWSLEGLNPGTTTIRFDYYRPWEGIENSIYTIQFLVTVSSDLKIVDITEIMNSGVNSSAVETGEDVAYDPIITTYEYDLKGNMTKKTVDGLYITNYVYGTDIDGVSHNGTYLTKEYSTLDGEEIAKYYTYDFYTGNLLASIDENGNRTNYLYDEVSRVIQINYFDGSSIGYQYNDYWDSNKSIYKYNSERTEIYYYNIYDNLTKYEVADVNPSLIGIEGNIELLSAIEYDSHGNKTKVINANGHSTRYKYDSEDRIIEKSLWENDTTKLSTISLKYQYYNNLNSSLLLTVTNQEDYINKYHYDIKNRLNKIQETTDKTNYYTTSYSYDYVDNVTSLTDARGNKTLYTYDGINRLINRTDAMNNITSYTYNSLNKLVEETNEKGISKYYEYDTIGRLIREKTPSSDGSVAITRYIYDNVGNIIKKIMPNNYDVTKDTPTLIDTMLGTSYTYDSRNRLQSTISPEGELLAYHEYDVYGKKIKNVDGLRYNEQDIMNSPGTTYYYEEYNLLLSKTIDALGNETNFTYDLVGNLTSKTDAKGNVTTYTYNPDNTVNQISYPDGGIVSYTYDKLGNLITEKDQRNNITSYSYDGFSSIKTTTDQYGNVIENYYDENRNLIKQIDAKGNDTLFTYNANNQLIETKIPLEEISGEIEYSIQEYQYDELGNIITIIKTGTSNPTNTRETYYTYYDNNLVKTISNNSGAYTLNNYDKNGNLIKAEKLRQTGIDDIAKYEYDLNDRQVRSSYLIDESSLYNADSYPNIANIRDGEYTGKVQLITEYEYDILGNLIKTTTPNAFKYLETDTTNRNKYTTSYTYDILNRLDEMTWIHDGQTVYSKKYYDQLGNVIEDRDGRGNSTTYSYDNMNRVTTVQGANGYLISYGYDLVGNKISITNGKNDTITYTYDSLDRVESIIDAYSVVITKNVYDENSNLIKTIDAKGYLSASIDEERYGTIYTYDLANRLVKVIDPEIADLNDPNLYTEKYGYNQYGEITSITDALGEQSNYQYDNAGRLAKVIDPLNVETTYTYDYLGNKLTMTDGKNNQTTYSYSDIGKLIAVTDANNQTSSYQYDLGLNPERIIDRNGNETKYEYNNQNLLTSRLVSETQDSINYQYDALGNRIGMTDETGTTTYTYNANNWITAIIKDGTTQLNYTYDQAGNILSAEDYKGNITNYTYDKSNRIEKVNYNISGETGEYTYSYDENGNRKMEGINLLVVTYKFDKNNRLIAMTNHELYANNTKPELIPKSTYKYTYDLAGRQITKTDDYGTTSYTYDELGRIKQIETPGKITIYTYDNAGNRATQIETYTSDQPSGIYVNSEEIQYRIKTTQYTYSNTNRLTTIIETMKDILDTELLEATTLYTYDNNGNQQTEQTTYISPLGIINDTDNISYTYDGFNRLKEVSTQTKTINYQYNGDDLRVKKISNGETTNYLYDRQYVILETDVNNIQKNRYIKGINYIGVINQTNEESLYVYNGHGDVVQTITPTWEILNQYDYDIFGNITLEIETNPNAIKYAGEYYDKDTGLYYLRARHYNPYTGRFITEDSYWGEDNNPLSLNLYTYAHNNPIKYIDPTGHAITEWDAQNLSQSDLEELARLTDEYNAATTQAEKDAAHVAAEAIRNAERSDNEVGTASGITVNSSTGEEIGGTVIYEPTYVPVIYDPRDDAPKDILELISDVNAVLTEIGDAFCNWPDLEQIWKDLTKSGDVDWFLELTLGTYKDENDIYHIRQDSWQRYVGYNDLYDLVFDMATDMDKAKFKFNYNDGEIILWAWKGDYINLGAGAELGIYYGGEPHWMTGTEYAMPMTLELKDQRGNQIFYWDRKQPQWWITGFDPSHQDVKASNLTAVYTINFSSNIDMFNAFYNSPAEQDKRWEFDTKTYTGTFTF